MIVAKLILVALFVMAWLRAKPSVKVEVSDIFVLSFLAIYLPGFLFNPTGETSLNALDLPDTAIDAAEFGFMLALAIGAALFLVRGYTERRVPWLGRVAEKTPQNQLSAKLAWSAAALSAIMFIALLVSADFRDFKWDVMRFFSFQFQGSDYRALRNTGYSDSLVVESILNRARFTVLPLLFCALISPLMRRGLSVVLFVATIVFFLALPASLSKLPVFFFAGYLVMTAASRFPALLDIGWLAVLTLVGAGVATTTLTLLYVAQYKLAVMNGSLQPFDLAIERLWGEPYSVAVRYFSVYPDKLPYTGWSGVNLVARALSLPVRMPDLEVAQTVLGADSGSNPGVFFLAGYAAFGMIGLGMFAAMGFLGLWVLDVIGRKIRLTPLRSIYLAVVGINVLFLNQIALQTAVVTYGLGLVPIMIWLLDRALLTRERSHVA